MVSFMQLLYRGGGVSTRSAVETFSQLLHCGGGVVGTLEIVISLSVCDRVNISLYKVFEQRRTYNSRKATMT